MSGIFMGRSSLTVEEWTVWDEERGNLVLVRAKTQKDAVRKGLKQGFLARFTHDCRPRTGDRTLMSNDEYLDFVENVLGVEV